MKSNRLFLENLQLASFLKEILLVCPRCGACARSRRKDEKRMDELAPRRLLCPQCGLSQEWEERSLQRRWREGHDDHFDCSLWLQTPCCGQRLWVYNLKHLEWLETFLGSRLRGRTRDPRLGWSNQGLMSRLPRWMKASRHRDELLKALQELRNKLPKAIP